MHFGVRGIKPYQALLRTNPFGTMFKKNCPVVVKGINPYQGFPRAMPFADDREPHLIWVWAICLFESLIHLKSC